MSKLVQSAAFTASQSPALHTATVKRSHLAEITAALLGYRTYAALVTEEGDATRDLHLSDAEIYVLNTALGDERAKALGSTNDVALQACISALKDVCEGMVFDSVADFYDSHAREVLAEAIYFSDSVADATAESNASFEDFPEMELACPTTADLWTARDTWTIEANGEMTGDYDPNGDRMFTGDKMSCRGNLTYRKAGRAGLVFDESDGSGWADDSWRDNDLDDERM